MAKELDPRDRFFHRELSWLAFNDRVLDEAQDMNNPLLERTRFLAIFVSNLDEFFMVRVAAQQRLVDSGYNRRDKFGYYAQELLLEVRQKADALIEKLYQTYDGQIGKELRKNKIFVRKFKELKPVQKKFVKKYFETTLFPIITPMAVDQGHPFPILPSRRTAFAVSLQKGDMTHLAIIPVPGSVPRLLNLPSESEEFSFILIDEIIRNYLDSFFKGYKIKAETVFRVIRDSELSIEEEYSPNLLKAIEEEIKKRPRAKVVHLEVAKGCSGELLESLCDGLDFPHGEARIINGYLDLTFLFALVSQVTRPALLFPSFVPQKMEYENIFDRINEGDFLVHVPYQSFGPTVDLIQSAAKDPDVLAIKMTLYRTNYDSGIIKGLKDAAKSNKQVTVLVELKARFDEEQNINWAKDLEDAGCHVIYGMPGIKIHSKAALVVRRESGMIRRYVHLATGNYNENTARVYTDIGFFTANDDFARDISDVFNVITGYSVPSRWKRIISSPYDLRKYFFRLTDKEIEFHKKFKNGLIFAKMNSLQDTKIIDKLYAASQAGVKIQLLVRGICCLVPGVPGLSENIQVRSIVGRFLEHSRIFLFNNNSSIRAFLSSADWMTRNFDRRIELLFEVYKDNLKEHLQFILETCWKDRLKTRVLLPGRTYERIREKGEKINSQDFFISHYTG